MSQVSRFVFAIFQQIVQQDKNCLNCKEKSNLSKIVKNQNCQQFKNSRQKLLQNSKRTIPKATLMLGLRALFPLGVEGLPDDVEQNDVWRRRKHPDPPKAYVDARPAHVQQVNVVNCPGKWKMLQS